jgi:hypothetical protein
MPKVGDKVRATLGESVIAGVVTFADYHGLLQIKVSDEAVPVVSINRFAQGWSVEQLVSVPTKFGAVIRRADGVLFQLVHPESLRYRWFTSDCAWAADAVATDSGFTVLFDGVDE